LDQKGFNSPENKKLNLFLASKDNFLPFLNSDMNFLDSSECLNPKLDPATGLILRAGPYKSIYFCSAFNITFLDCVPLFPKIHKITTEKLPCPYFNIDLDIYLLSLNLEGK
jgi:hypothetical protein